MSSLRDRMNRLRGVKAAEESEDSPMAEAQAAEAEAERDRLASERSEESAFAGAAEPESPADAPAEQPVRSGATWQGAAELTVQEDEAGPGWAKLGVRLHANGSGECLERRLLLPLNHRSGHHRLKEWIDACARLSAFHPEEQAAPSPGDVLFLDLETTGLGGGAGNVAFMMGLGYFEAEGYVVRQFLIRHPAEERAMLAELEALLPRFRWLATYNGRSFDWPLVQTRLILNGLGRSLPELLHLDFLHPSRSLWKNTLASCRLSHVEEERLGIFRQDDVPGSMAPTLYFRYLAEEDPSVLEGVFRHNEQDMVTLACLGIRFGRLLAGEAGSAFPMPDAGEELLRTGLWLERMGEPREAERMYGRIAASGAAPDVLHGLAMRDKKAGNWERAVVLWQLAAARGADRALPDWRSHVELAMYFEHRAKDSLAALELAEEALGLASAHPLQRRDARRRAELEELRRRRDRLLRKAGAASDREAEA